MQGWVGKPQFFRCELLGFREGHINLAIIFDPQKFRVQITGKVASKFFIKLIHCRGEHGLYLKGAPISSFKQPGDDHLEWLKRFSIETSFSVM